MGEPVGGRRVVVGVDGSTNAVSALRYAIEEAARRGATVAVVAVFEPPEAWAFAYGTAVLPDGGERRRAVADSTQDWVAGVRAELPAPLRAVPVGVEAVTGSPVVALVHAAADAELLVVGHRGRGAVRSALLGSVGLGCVLHAPCPVTVVPAVPSTEPVDERVDEPGRVPVGARPGPVGPLL